MTIAALLLGATLAVATPAVRVRAIDGIARIELTGSYPQSRYTVFRSPAAAGPWGPVTSFDVLCLGPCFADDASARAGQTYWYRFDFVASDGSSHSFGPYAVTIPALPSRSVGVRVTPNPARGAAALEVQLSAEAGVERVPAQVRIFDLQGRLVRSVYEGALPRGTSRLAWDGRDEAGRPAGAGAYFVTVRSPLGEARARLQRVR